MGGRHADHRAEPELQHHRVADRRARRTGGGTTRAVQRRDVGGLAAEERLDECDRIGLGGEVVRAAPRAAIDVGERRRSAIDGGRDGLVAGRQPPGVGRGRRRRSSIGIRPRCRALVDHRERMSRRRRRGIEKRAPAVGARQSASRTRESRLLRASHEKRQQRALGNPAGRVRRSRRCTRSAPRRRRPASGRACRRRRDDQRRPIPRAPRQVVAEHPGRARARGRPRRRSTARGRIRRGRARGQQVVRTGGTDDGGHADSMSRTASVDAVFARGRATTRVGRRPCGGRVSDRGEQLRDLGDLVGLGRQATAGRGVLPDLLGARRAGDHARERRLGEEPAERGLEHRDAARARRSRGSDRARPTARRRRGDGAAA